MHFTERFFKIFHFTLLTAYDTGPDRLAWPEAAKKLEDLLAQEEALSLPPGFSLANHMESLQPVMLWIDERFLTSNRPDASQWYAHSLQQRYFDTNLGGAIFFQRLEELLVLRYQSLEITPVPPPTLGAQRFEALWI
ncbi:MAG: DotU family type IV/VI secretion system protein, partial [Deltaproteobacteria bacterium]|nr:DotU family type IV/VI secretion system protein [Deltaproteobacteria bacterium]